jgi:hypothetical protein
MTKIPKEAVEAACQATVLGEDIDGLPMHLEPREAIIAISAPLPHLAKPVDGERWLPINQADREITDVQDFSEVGVILRNSDPYWVRDEDGRIYEAVWTDDKEGYWWDLEGESPVDPVEFMPHPLDRRFTTAMELKS